MKKKNIAIIIPTLGYGGAERVAQLLGDHLCKCGHNVFYFLTGKKKEHVYPVNGQVIDIQELVGSNYSDEVAGIFRYVLALRKEKRKYRIQASVSFMGWCNLLNILSKGSDRIILSIHTTLSARNDTVGLPYDKRVIKSLYNLSDYVIAVSEFSRIDLISNYGMNEKKVKTINNPVVIRKNISEKDWEYGNDCVVCVGRYDPVKQHDRIIKAFSYVHQHNNKAKLILVGDGKNRDYLEFIAGALNIKNNVVFTGFTDNVGYYLLHSKVFVMASRTEGFPVSMTEAMAYSIPIVSTDSPGGCKEILGGEGKITEVTECKYGIMTPYIFGKAGKGKELDENELMLGKAILKLLSDQKLYEHYSAMSAERTNSYEYEKIMKEWDAVIS